MKVVEMAAWFVSLTNYNSLVKFSSPSFVPAEQKCGLGPGNASRRVGGTASS